jgi:L-rhamnose mutarotase
MLAAEDEEDVMAMQVAKAEAAKEMDEFDEEALVVAQDDDGADEDGSSLLNKPASVLELEIEKTEILVVDEATEEKDMETEFAKWQAKVGPDFHALKSALKPIERYALHLRTEIEPYYSIFYNSEQSQIEAIMANDPQGEKWDIEEIERGKEEEVFILR